uniref:Uncharacterized protein n=1 Tax=Aegilops tauschii subsp. strangulata TaxID=200361 RepID=A0A453EWG4_AEGTS
WLCSCTGTEGICMLAISYNQCCKHMTEIASFRVVIFLFAGFLD